MKTETKHTPSTAAKRAALNIRQWLSAHGQTPSLPQSELTERIQIAVDEENKAILAQRDELREALRALLEVSVPERGQVRPHENCGCFSCRIYDVIEAAQAALAKCEPQAESSTSFYIFVDRGDGKLSTDGCWGGEHNHFESRPEAHNAIVDLANLYPDCDWVLIDRDNREIERIPHKKTEQDAYGFAPDKPEQAQAKGRWT